VRRAKLDYLRELRGKKARIRERRVGPEELAAAQSTSAEGTLEGTSEQQRAIDEAAGTEPVGVPETAAVEAESKG
jgi:hypothetical protein